MWLLDLMVSVTAGVATFIICKWLDRNDHDNQPAMLCMGKAQSLPTLGFFVFIYVVLQF